MIQKQQIMHSILNNRILNNCKLQKWYYVWKQNELLVVEMIFNLVFKILTIAIGFNKLFSNTNIWGKQQHHIQMQLLKKMQIILSFECYFISSIRHTLLMYLCERNSLWIWTNMCRSSLIRLIKMCRLVHSYCNWQLHMLQEGNKVGKSGKKKH